MSPTSKDAYQGMNSHQSSGASDHVDDAAASNTASFNLTQLSESHGQAQPFGSPSTTSSGELQQSGAQHEDKDPFTSPGTKQKPEQKLSATASAFQPFMFRMNAPAAQGEASFSQQLNYPSSLFNAYVASNSSATPGSVNTTPAKVSNSQAGAFSTDTRVTRALRISGIYVPTSREQVESCLQGKTIPAKATRRFYQAGNEVLLRFSDVQDAVVIYNYAKASHPEWAVDYISPTTCAEKSLPGSPFVSAHEGQVLAIARLPALAAHDNDKIESIIVDLLSIDGAIYAYQKQLASEHGTLRMVVEFCDVGSAHRAVARLNGATVRGLHITLSLHKPDVEQRSARISPVAQQTPVRPHTEFDDVVGSIQRMSIGSPPMFNSPPIAFPYTGVLSPTGRSFVPGGFPMTPNYAGMSVPFAPQFSSPQTPATGYAVGGLGTPSQFGSTSITSGSPRYTDGTPGGSAWDSMSSPLRGSGRGQSIQDARAFGRRQNAVRGTTRPTFNNQVGQHNVVDVERIRQGLDVRTTIMLRNIPNKIDQQMLKGIIDETSFGLYDFMYLRIDFANNCNVGYAFINFEDPWHIINFVEARAGQRWNRYNSDKVAEVSYATIQGKDCLVQKFRNSSVMLEHPSFRPKIFRAGNHPEAGQEEDFPLPDNASKMRRSVENAEHVGLFAPRAGQHYRDEQRRRRSQYDRGTRLAALEEYEYEDAMSFAANGNSNYTCKLDPYILWIPSDGKI